LMGAGDTYTPGVPQVLSGYPTPGILLQEFLAIGHNFGRCGRSKSCENMSARLLRALAVFITAICPVTAAASSTGRCNTI
jgi:hypothetical protein